MRSRSGTSSTARGSAAYASHSPVSRNHRHAARQELRHVRRRVPPASTFSRAPFSRESIRQPDAAFRFLSYALMGSHRLVFSRVGSLVILAHASGPSAVPMAQRHRALALTVRLRHASRAARTLARAGSRRFRRRAHVRLRPVRMDPRHRAQSLNARRAQMGRSRRRRSAAAHAHLGNTRLHVYQVNHLTSAVVAVHRPRPV